MMIKAYWKKTEPINKNDTFDDVQLEVKLTMTHEEYTYLLKECIDPTTKKINLKKIIGK